MGNLSGRSSCRRKANEFSEQLSSACAGKVVISCSFEKWVGGIAQLLGFAEKADYTSKRADFRAKGFLLKPDVTEGRYVHVAHVTDCEISLHERNTGNDPICVSIPKCNTSGRVKHKAGMGCRRVVMNFVQQQTSKDGMGVIGCRGSMVVVQVLDRTECFVPEFYFIDLEAQCCTEKFYTKDSELVWHECYISPDKSKVLLRPDVNTYSWSSADKLHVHNLKQVQVITMKKFADCGRYVLSFDNRHGNRYLLRARDRTVELFDLETMEVVKSSENLSVPAPIHQIKSSPSGQYIAVRSVYPVYSMEFLTNQVFVLSANTMEILLTASARGPYWPVSEVVNLQVFPVFSGCDSAMAVMKNAPTKRKIYIYKLPLLTCSLRQLCRRVIRRNVAAKNLRKLPLPQPLLNFLQYEDFI